MLGALQGAFEILKYPAVPALTERGSGVGPRWQYFLQPVTGLQCSAALRTEDKICCALSLDGALGTEGAGDELLLKGRVTMF